MNKYIKHSQEIKKEAESLISKYNLIETISKYGELYFTGSYDLDLMYKKDIDISLVNDSLVVQDFTQLGKELIDVLETPSVYYRNTRVNPVEKRPENGLYWGIKTGEWWIDLWAMEKKVFVRSRDYLKDIKSKITEEKRIIILELKDFFMREESYGRKFGSRELYDAVLNKSVKTAEEFREYLNSKSHLNEYQ